MRVLMRVLMRRLPIVWHNLHSSRRLCAFIHSAPAMPCSELFTDLRPKGQFYDSPCKLPRMEDRAISLQQLAKLRDHISRRCDKERWQTSAPVHASQIETEKALTPQTVTLYDVCAYVLKPATFFHRVRAMPLNSEAHSCQWQTFLHVACTVPLTRKLPSPPPSSLVAGLVCGVHHRGVRSETSRLVCCPLVGRAVWQLVCVPSPTCSRSWARSRRLQVLDLCGELHEPEFTIYKPG